MASFTGLRLSAKDIAMNALGNVFLKPLWWWHRKLHTLP
jgi:hypothetical protein